MNSILEFLGSTLTGEEIEKIMLEKHKDRVFVIGNCKDVKEYKKILKGKYKTIISYTNNKALSRDAKEFVNGKFVYTSNIYRGLAVSSLDTIILVNQSKENIKYIKHMDVIYRREDRPPSYIEVSV